jgi:hypothetical protein
MTAVTATLAEVVANAAPPAALGTSAEDSVVVFAVSLLVGGLAIHVAASHLVGAGEYGDALLTALLGAVAWAILDVVPFVGPLLALVAWVGVIKWRYPVGGFARPSSASPPGPSRPSSWPDSRSSASARSMRSASPGRSAILIYAGPIGSDARG